MAISTNSPEKTTTEQQSSTGDPNPSNSDLPDSSVAPSTPATTTATVVPLNPNHNLNNLQPTPLQPQIQPFMPSPQVSSVLSSFRPATPALPHPTAPQFSPIPSPSFQNHVQGQGQVQVQVHVQPPGVMMPPPSQSSGPMSSVPQIMQPQYGQPGQQPMRMYAPMPNGYQMAGPQGTMHPPGILRYAPPPYPSILRPAYPQRPVGPAGVIPALPRPAIMPMRGPVVPTIIRPPINLSVTPTEKPQTTVYVGKIASTVENDLMLSLLQLCGSVKSWKRAQDPSTGALKGFGFCEFESAEGVLRALRLLSKLSIDGQELMLNVNQATREFLERYVEKKKENLKNVKTTDTGGAGKEEASESKKEPLKHSVDESTKDDKDEANKETNDNATFGLVTNEDKEADGEASEKIKDMIEERIKNKPLPPPPPPPQTAPDGSANSNADRPARSRDGDSDADITRNDAAEDKNDEEMTSKSKLSSEHERPETSSPDRNKSDRRSKDRDRDLKREKERELERYEREREQERAKREREREYKIREDERRYRARLKEWESREKEKERARKQEREREKDREQDRKYEILDQENDDGYSKKRKHRSSGEEREERKRRLREKEEDMDDRIKEEEEIAEAKRRDEEEREQLKEQQKHALEILASNASNGSENAMMIDENLSEIRNKAAEETSGGDMAHVNEIGNKIIQNGTSDDSETRQNNTVPTKRLGFGLVGSGKRTTVPSLFHEEEDEDAQKDKKMRPLVPIDYTTEELQAVHDTTPVTPSSNLAAAAEFAKRIGNANSKEDRPDSDKERSRRDRSSHRDRDRNFEENRKEAVGLEKERDRGLEKVKTPDNKKLLDAKQLIDTIPKTKDELFSYEIKWVTYDKNGLHERMRPWISKKITEFLGEEETTLVDYIVSSTQEHVTADEMLDRLQSILVDAPDGKSTKSLGPLGSSSSNSIVDTSHDRGLGSRDTSTSTGRSHRSFDSIEHSFGRESSRSNLSEVAVDLIVKADSTSTQSSTLYSPYGVYDSPRSSHSPFSLGSGKHILNQRQDSGKVSHTVPASPLRTFRSSEFVPDTEGTTPEELKAEARMWERNARKLMVDLDLSKKESSNQIKNLENVTMELSASQTECNELKREIKHLKVLLSESAVKEMDNDNLKVQVQDKNDIQTELEEEIKFQKELNNNLSLQLNKTQEANLELVLVLQELEETIEKQRLEINSHTASKLQENDKEMMLDCENENTGEKDKRELELELQKFLESQAKLENTIAYLEKALEEKTQEIELERSLKKKEIFSLEEKLLEALAVPVLDELKSLAIENPDLIEEIKALKEKVMKLERDCNELTDENLELLFKLKESSKDLSTSGTSINSSLGERVSTESPSIGDSEGVNIWQIEKEEKKMNHDGILQTRCNDLESKCAELELQMEGFKDRACYLDGELEKYRAKAEEQEKEIAELNQLLEYRKEEQHANSFAQEEQADVILGDSFKDKDDKLEKLITELKSRIEDLGNELSDKTSEIEALKSDHLLKENEILSQNQITNSQLEESLKTIHTKDSHILELESCNRELELHLAEVEEDNLHLSERISGLEPQLRYLTDARESSRLEAEHSESHVINLQAEITRLENELETTKFDMRQKVQDMQKRWLEAQEECEYLKKANPKLESTTENLMEECSSLQKSNSELRQQRLELHNHCTALEAKLRDSEDNFLKFSKSLEDLEEKLSLILDGIGSKEKTLDSELDVLHMQVKEQTEKYVIVENSLKKMFSEKVAEVEKLQQEVAHLSSQIASTHDERDRMASEAVLEMHVLRADKDKLDKAIADMEGKLRSSETKLDTIRVEYETRILELTNELGNSKQNLGVLASNHEKLMEFLENTRSNEEKLKNKVNELSTNSRSCEYEKLQLAEENSSLEVQLQKVPVLQDQIVALKNSLNDVKYENERLEASLQMISGDYEQLKEEKGLLLQKASSMHKAVVELEDHKRNKIALEEKLLRLQGDLTAREALCAQDAELKNEVGRLKRSNSQLQWKINHLQEEKTLEEEKKGFKPDENESAANNTALSFGSDSTSSLHEDVEASTVDESSRIQSLEIALAEALQANETYKEQLKSFLSEEQVRKSEIPVELELEDQEIHKENKHDASLLETELRELQERYLHMSLKYAEVEAQREELVLKLKAVGPGRSWFS